MAKKDFSTSEKAFDAIAEATAAPEEPARKERKTYTDAEAAELLAQYKTSGRKGLELPRINVAFTPDLYLYIRTMARVTGQTYTDFINDVMRQYMDAHREIYDQAMQFKNSL